MCKYFIYMYHSTFCNILYFATFFGIINVVSTNTIKLLFPTKINDYLLLKVGEKCASTTHSIIVAYLGIRVLMSPGIWLHRIHFISEESLLLSNISCGYFLYDFIMCLARLNIVGPVFLGHAVMAFTINCISVVSGVGHFYTAAFLVWEISTPFVNVRYFMNKLQIRGENIINALIIFLFLFCRIIWGTFIYYIIIIDTIYVSEGLLLKIPVFIAFLMNALNYYWFYKMVKIVYSKLQ